MLDVQRSRFGVFKAAVVLVVVLGACGGADTNDSDTSSPSTDVGNEQPAEPAVEAEAAEADSVPEGFTLLEGLRVDDGPFEDFSTIPQPGPVLFFNGSTTFRDASPTEPIIQQWSLLEEAESATRFYMTEMEKNGFEFVSGFNNALQDVSEIEPDALQYQLVYIYPDGRRGDMLITPDDRIGESSVFANARPAS